MAKLKYPKDIKLGGDTYILEKIGQQNRGDLFDFYRSLPKEDLLYINQDITDPEVFGAFMSRVRRKKTFCIVARHKGKIVASADLYTHAGWIRHVGDLRIIIAPGHRKKGLGRKLAMELVERASELGLDKCRAEVMSTQRGAIQAFEKIGFIKEAVLKDMAMDWNGRKHDILVMINDTGSLYNQLETMIIEMEHPRHF